MSNNNTQQLKDDNQKLFFLVGPHGGGKTTFIYKEMLKSITNKDGNLDLNKKAFLVVPEQDTKEKQKAFMDYKENKSRGMLNCDVVSFDRICHMVFSKLMLDDIDSLNIIQDDMKALLCQIAVERRSKDLPLYKRKARKIGFSQKLASAISEFATYKIDQDKINKIINDTKVDKSIKDELSELLVIQDEFNSLLERTDLNIVENKMKILSENIDKVDIFDNATIFFDGFTGFSPLQKEVFDKIENKANRVYVSIDYRQKELDEYLLGKYDNLNNYQKYENNIFHISDLFMESLCDKSKIKDSIIILNDGLENKYHNSKDLLHIEENILSDSSISKTDIKSDNVFVRQNKDILSELEWTINKIIELTRINDNPITYNDIKLIVPNLENYRDYIISKFDKYNIPLFIDDSQSIFYSPYIKAIRSFLDLCNEDMSYESLMGYMNSGLFDKDGIWSNEQEKSSIADKGIYYFDNALRMFGVNHYRALSEKRAFLRNINRYILKNKEKEHDTIKNVVEKHASDILKVYEALVQPLMKLYEKHIIKNKDKQFSLCEFVALIKEFISDTNLDAVFDRYVNNLKEADKTGIVGAKFTSPKDFVMLAGSKDKISKILNLLEKIGKTNVVDNIEVKYNLQELSQILDSAIDIFKVKSIPFSMDQVVVGDLMRSRFDNPKVLFFLGMNDSTLPAKRNDDNIINDKMREAFFHNDIQLSQSLTETTYNSRFYTYLALTNPSEKLYLSYTKANSEGEQDYKSRFLLDVEELFVAIDSIEHKDLPIYDIKQMKEFIALHNAENTRVLNKIDEYITQYHDLSDYKKEMIKNAIISKEYFDLLKTFDKDNKQIDLDNKAYKKINVRHTNISKNNIEKLYNGKLTTSATAMEQYANCPYKFFLENMIGISERENNDIDARNIGNIFHATIEKFFENGNHYPNVVAYSVSDSSGDNSKILSDDSLRQEIYDIAQSAIDKEFETQAKVNDRKSQQFLIERLKEIIYVSIMYMLKQLKTQAPLVKVYHELPFDDYVIEEKANASLRGRIDQVELLQSNLSDKVLYIKVVDYKSSTKKIDKNKISEGQMIQFIIYLDYIKKALDNKTFIDNVKNYYGADDIELNKYDKFEILGTFYKSILDNIVTIKREDFEKYKKNILKKDEIEVPDKELFKSYVDQLRNDKMKMTGIVNISDDKYKTLDCNAKANKITTETNEKIDNANTNIASLQPDGAVSLKYDNELIDMINQVREKLSDEINNIRNGIFPVSPQNNACEYCSFAGSCGIEKHSTEESDDYE